MKCLAIAGLLLVPLSAAAQDPARSFDELSSRIQPGENVRVIGRQGEDVRGTLLDVSSTGVTVMESDGARRSFSPDAVTVIRRADRLINGMAIGGQVGAGLGLLALAVSKGGIFRPCSSDSGSRYYSCAAGIIAAVAGGGVVIGAGIDRSLEEVLYIGSNTTARVRWAPLLAGNRRGVTVAVRF